MAVSRYYSSVAQPTTLTGNISAGATSVGVSSPTGFPTSYPFTAAIDYGTATEELVDVTAASGGTWTVTRGVDGTSAQSHAIGAPVRHVTSARDSADSRAHEAATAAVHGVAGTLVGTSDAQTLANKTLTAPAVVSPAITGGGSLAGTFTGAPTFSGPVVLSGTPNISNGAALGGTITGSPTLSGSPTFSGAPVFTGGPSFTTNSVLFQRASAGQTAMRTSITGDVSDRHQVTGEGIHNWGPGNAATDTNLYRLGVNSLKTDGDYAVGGALSVAGAASVGGALSAGNMNLGAWASWTPTWTTSTGLHSPSYGNAVVTGTSVKLGRILVCSLAIQFGTTTVFGSGAGTSDNWLFSLPASLTASGTFAGTQVICGFGRATQSASATLPFSVRVNSAGTGFSLDSAGGRQDGAAVSPSGTLDSITPWTWASGDVFSFFAVVETTT